MIPGRDLQPPTSQLIRAKFSPGRNCDDMDNLRTRNSPSEECDSDPTMSVVALVILLFFVDVAWFPKKAVIVLPWIKL